MMWIQVTTITAQIGREDTPAPYDIHEIKNKNKNTEARPHVLLLNKYHSSDSQLAGTWYLFLLLYSLTNESE